MDTPTMQRVRSHGAALDRRAFELADRFLDAFFARCPHLRQPDNRFRGTPDRQRRGVAHQWAWFVRNLGQIERVSPELDALASYLRARGLTDRDFTAARDAMIETLKDLSGPDWTPALASDWTAALDACLRCMCPARSHTMPGSGGYAMAA